MILVILGPQGSGKGTQARKMADKHNLFYLDAGALLREIAKTDSRIDEIVNKRGQLLEDEEIYKIISSRLESSGVDDNIIFDGYPRSIKQFEMIGKWLAQHNKELNGVIFLDISDDVAIRRLSSRRIHEPTGKVYNTITNPPPDNIPPEELTHREDDKPEAIKERLSAYHSTTQPLIEFLNKNYPDKVFRVNGELSIEEVEAEIDDIIKKING